MNTAVGTALHLDHGLSDKSGDSSPGGDARPCAVTPKAVALMRVCVLGTLAAHVLLLVGGIHANFITVDEVGHVSAGLSYWRTGRYTEYRVNPPLSKIVATASVYALYPGRTRDDLYATPSGLEVVRLARLAGILWSVAGALLIGRWASRLYGPWAGCLALALWCFDPNVLAHAGLMTPDVPSAVIALGASYAFWRYLRAPTWGRAVLAGVLLGAAELTKFTLLILYPVWLVLWLAYRFRSADRPPLRSEIGRGAVIVLASLVVLNLGYDFTGTFRPLASYRFTSQPLAELGADGGSGPGGWFRSVPVPLPSDYLLGIDEQRAGIQARRANYLCGEWSRDGWWYYYVVGAAVKVPLPLWLLALWGLGLLLSGSGRAAHWRDEVVLLLPAACVFLLVSSQTGINRHVRYLLPMLPFVLIHAGKVGSYLRTGPPVARACVCGLIAWLVAGTVWISPHFLSYFNEAAGGPRNGHAYLVDSNIDWGQDLLALKRWLEEHPDTGRGRLGLAYFNVLDPRVIGIEYDLPPPGPDPERPRDIPQSPEELGPRPGLFAVSVNYLRGLSFRAPDGRGGWKPVGRRDYEYFLHMKPVATAGYSIYIYRVTPAEADRVRRLLGLPPLHRGSEAGDGSP